METRVHENMCWGRDTVTARLSYQGLLGMRTSILRHFCHTEQQLITVFALL